MHVAALQIYDPGPGGGDVGLDDIVELITNRAHLIDCFHSRLLATPLRLDHPLWVNDPAFDARRHLREETLPAPGDWQALRELAGRLMAEPLPRDRPLWHMCVIRGLHRLDLPENAFAVFTRIHHAAVDGVAGIGVTAALHDLQPDNNVVQMPARIEDEEDLDATQLTIAGLWKEMLRPWRTLAALPALRRLAGSARATRPPQPAPRTRINRRLSGDRCFDAIRIPLAQLKDCEQLTGGATVNDVVLTLIGGALRRYLQHHGELPQKSLAAMVPISTHTNALSTNTGNQVTQMIVPLGTNEANAGDRMAHIHARTEQAKAAAGQMDADAIDTVTALAPAVAVEFAAKNLPLAPLVFNTVVTNVKGPPIPLYLCGARMIRAYGMGPLVDKLGIFHTVLSYDGEVTLTVLTCSSVMPDLDVYVDCLRSELETLSNKLPEAGSEYGYS